MALPGAQIVCNGQLGIYTGFTPSYPAASNNPKFFNRVEVISDTPWTGKFTSFGSMDYNYDSGFACPVVPLYEVTDQDAILDGITFTYSCAKRYANDGWYSTFTENIHVVIYESSNWCSRFSVRVY